MQFDWTTFALELINFLVLVWILARFLFAPVSNAIARRKAAIEQTLAEARTVRADGEQLKRQYESRLADWAGEREEKRARLREELAAEGARLQAALQSSLEQERQKSRVLEEQRAAEAERTAFEAARARGGRFVARLLARLANPELERAMLDALLEDLHELGVAETRALRDSAAEAGYRAKVRSRYPLSPDGRARLCEALAQVLDHPVTCEFEEDSALLAGLRIALGHRLLHANLQDEMRYFSEVAR